MTISRRLAWFVGISVLFLAVYAAISLSFPKNSHTLAIIADLTQCCVPLVANTGLLLNAGTPHWRRNFFWILMAMGCTLWLIGQLEWTYHELYLHKSLPDLYLGDILFFLRGIPMIAALLVQPHQARGSARFRFGYIDFVLLLSWWSFVYAYTVLPWMLAVPDLAQYNFNFNLISFFQNLMIVAGLLTLWLRAEGAWRTIYANLFAAQTTYLLIALFTDLALESNQYYSGSLYDLPMIASFLWLALGGVIAFLWRDKLDIPQQRGAESTARAQPAESLWAARLAMAAVLSLPVFALYALRFSHESPAVREFRLMTTMIAAIPLMLLVFIRIQLAARDHTRLLAQSEHSLENLRRLQVQLVQSEKLVSLGQLAAGAAHEINNPLAAILGFSDLLADDPAVPEKPRAIAAKIRDQARRTKTLVGNLLSFARQVPAERTLLDINTVVKNAVQLRELDLRSENTRIELQLETVLPGVRGDGNQLMQVFFNIISNGLDAMQPNGGVLTIKTIRDRSNVVVLIMDTGPGIKEPHRVFDPFYTTKPVGKGTGLGLSICFGIVQEHGGKILCYNSQEGGAVFRVELPAVLAALMARDLQPLISSNAPRKSE
jgi:signal transduction histidine kinase